MIFFHGIKFLYFFKRQNDDEEEFKSGFASELAAFDDDVETMRDDHVEIGTQDLFQISSQYSLST